MNVQIESSSAFGKGRFVERMEKDLSNRFPSTMKNIQRISIGKNKDSTAGSAGAFKMSSPAIQQSGIYMAHDSKIRSYVANMQKGGLVIESPPEVVRHIQDSMEGFLAKGMNEETALSRVKDSVQTYMHFDKATGNYVVTPVVPKINDSLLSGTAIPYWNIGYLNKIFKQPFATSYAKNLVSVEGFGNPWCDAVAVFKESFEGFGRISNVARGSLEGNNSNPITNEMGQIMSDIVNIAIDYETSIEENMRSKQAGNFLGAVGIADREKYGAMVMDRMQDALIIFGNAEAGVDGLIDVATGGEVAYIGTPFNDIVVNPAVTNKGAVIIEAMNELIGEFLRENLYMATELRINCSTYVMKAMTMTTYSQGFNPASPMQVISGNFDGQQKLGGGVQSCKWTLVADPMLDPNTPFNPEDTDLFIITVPSVKSALEDQTGLVISPEVLSQYIVPPMYQRGGMLYTMYKRVGGIIAPVVNTVRVWRGVGYVGT